jgi:GR25 family glycosyltransferase involved in LPS biosynthesis
MVDHIYCINLERRPDRRESAQREFDRNGITGVEFFKGTDGRADAPDGLRISKPEWGCSDSHIRIWKDILDNGYECALIFEDDIRILPDFNAKLQQVLYELKSFPDWDYVNLAPLPWKLGRHQVSPMLTEGAAWGAHCYLVSIKGARKIGTWKSTDLRYCQDVQIARSPLEMYYCTESMANQESYDSAFFGVFTSVFKGDIGFARTPDWDFIFRHQWKLNLFIVMVALVIALYFINRHK